MKIDVVIVAYESHGVLGGCLETLGRHPDVAVTVVDSGSPGWRRSRDIAVRRGASWLGLEQNVGYGTASNRGARETRAEWLVFLNPDVRITARDIVEVVATGAWCGADMLGPVLGGEGTRPESLERSFTASEYVRGACLAVRAELFHRIGGFDERFFMFAEEDDLARRARSVGAILGCARHIVAETSGGQSSAASTRRWAVTEREVALCQLGLKRRGTVFFAATVVRSVTRVLSSTETAPRTESLRQLARGLSRVYRLRRHPPVREDVTVRQPTA